MKLKSKLTFIVLCILILAQMHAQIPLVYTSENSGSSCAKPPLPDPIALKNYPLLPDPFAWSDGKGRVTDFKDWECRRNEIKSEIEQYEIGVKPP
jgi:hypothetical protein